LRAPASRSDSGFAYAARHYQLRPGAEPGPLTSPPGWSGDYDGYEVIVFPQDAGVFQALIVRRSDDHELAALRHDAVFDVAAAAIPSIAAWVDPERAVPRTSVMAGAGLMNSYRGQLGDHGELALPGLVCVGDTVLTTNPADGKGVATSLMQAQALLASLDEQGGDLASAALSFDQWCTRNMKPWYEDQVRIDGNLSARWRGEPIDLSQPLPSDLICTLWQVDPSYTRAIGMYFSMLAGPNSLLELEPLAREHLRSGYTPDYDEGPTRDELAELIGQVSANERYAARTPSQPES
jgi:hypothetical protein